jgi:hypothetical protein
MFCSFDQQPKIVRLWGRGEAVLPFAPDFAALVSGFPDHPGVRSVIRVAVTRIADSCGFGVPRMRLVDERDALDRSHAKLGREGLADYRRRRNAASIDGLPAWPAAAPSAPAS